MFADQVKIYIRSGKGGDGHVGFRRELFVPAGGPNGGDGGKGGDVIFVVDEGLNTLSDFRHMKKYCAPNGEDGGKNRCHGADAEDLIIKVPEGTVIRDAESGRVIADMSHGNKRGTVLKGGRGGKGNQHYATATMQAPKYAQPGQRAMELVVTLELKVIADVGLVGFPNVGKSTLFNIFADSRISIVEDTPGVTRDRLYAEAEWLDRRFMMVDTGGIEIANTDSIAVSIREQAKIAIKEADVILFVCDARTGVTTEDHEVAKLIRMAQKPVVLAVNKADTPTQELEAYEFYNLGIGEPYMISASNRLNLGDLLDAVVSHFPDEDESDDDDHDDDHDDDNDDHDDD